MVKELSHPLVTELVNRLRKTTTNANQFQQTIEELSRILFYETCQSVSLQNKTITTWHGDLPFDFIDQSDLVLIPIMRAGLPMLNGLQSLLLDAPNGFLAMKRDEVTHIAKTYYKRLPDCSGKTVILLDPMLATGGSLSDAITLVKKHHPKQIFSLNIIGSPEGVKAVIDSHPDISITIAKIDERLDENKFIYPGLGDAGDRAFNTPE
ncbi:uracil phosphoribosyltransferase [Thiomicrorhabdus sp.]|uniref:uracil phosphoribosyltransferase n=1 Tax=Thiomicrorhabdus sp. TaxID=2039724 RepID=UPI002AA89CDD|nr:uracil phosphoribosyltransferase [Thiomicrorhabdus sp.]